MGQTTVLIEFLNKVPKSCRLTYSEMARSLGMRPIKNKKTLESRRLTYAEVARGLEMRRIIDKEG